MSELPVVIHVIAKLELGGAQRIAIETARRLKGYRNILVSGTGGMLDDEALSLKGVETHLLTSLKREIHPVLDFLAFLEIGKIISKELAMGRNVVVHSHGSKAGVLARLAGRAAGASAVIHTIHGFAFHDGQPTLVKMFYVLIERFCARFCDCLIAVSRSTVRKGLKERIGILRQYAVINPAILDEHLERKDFETRAKRKELGIEESSRVVGTVSCLKPQKAPLDFVEVAGIVHKAFPAVEFVMVGDGILMDEVRRAVSLKGLEGVFHLLGWREDVPEVVDVFDVFLLTSLWEGLPMVHAEAMCRSKPIVATRVDGTPEVVGEGVNGFLASPRDVKGLAEKVVKLLEDDQLRKKMGEAGKKMVSPRFTMDRLVSEVDSLYARLLSS
ncbi:glycosyltransferase family 1 protein [candidate division TA06 bacterium]|uniref:Glycosyltransferase family 1 protein n=1 Tax=candidate division TA06 bacterium TaxID=2250710 RepID=A0A523XK98_UNCT6|nr:MAG: glycosyltransferase family 1 protein [candidate division TA06 bacterium]